MELNIRIRELRKSQGMTLSDLAKLMNISVPHLSEVERGKKNLNNHLILRAAEALKVKPGDLTSDDNPVADAETLADLEDLGSVYVNLGQSDRQRIQKLARHLHAAAVEAGEIEPAAVESAHNE